MGYLIGDERDKINGFDQLPLGILSLFSNVIGTMGNALVLFVFLRRYTESTNYKIFVVYMAFQDLGTCVAHIAKEFGRMVSVNSNAISEIICSSGQYMGNSVGTGAVCMALFITFERNRKICTPFRKQITLFQSKVMCLVTFVYGAVVNIPMYYITGRRAVVIENINATRCSIKNKYDSHPLPISFLTIQAVSILVSVVIEVIYFIKIKKRLTKQSKFKFESSNATNFVWTSQSKEFLQSVSRSSIQSDESTQSDDISQFPSQNFIDFLGPSKKKRNKQKGHSENPQGKQPTNKHSKMNDKENAKNIRIIRTLSVVLLLLVISYFSFSMFQIFLCYNRFFVGEVSVSRSWDLMMEYASDIVTINGILNPFVYFFTDIKFHAEVRRIFCRCC